MMYKAYLNADVGEGAGFDQAIIPLVGAVNISCGAHAGNEMEITNAVRVAVKNGVEIGAHPGYPDKENYGRVELNLEAEALKDTLYSQLDYLNHIVQNEGGKVSYIKPHGALYNKMATDYFFSCDVIEFLNDWQSLPLVALAQSEAVSAGADLGLGVKSEGFMDRGYTDDGLLLSRSLEGALIQDSSIARDQAHALLNGSEFLSVTGKPLSIPADTVCVHGDTASAVELLQRVLLPIT